MKLEQLRHFLAAAKHQHLGKASQQVAISTSAIWHSIRGLESEFGQRLFSKKGRQIVLTAAGKQLQRHASTLLTQAAQVQQHMQAPNTPLAGHYRLAATHGFVEQLLTPAWLQLCRQHTLLSADIFSLRSPDIVQKVAAGEVDFGLCLSPYAMDNIVIHTLVTGNLVLVLRKNHPLFALPAKQQLAKLASYPAALPKADLHVLNCEKHPALIKHHIKPQVKLYYDDYAVAISALLHSDYWTLLPQSLMQQHAKHLQVLQPTDWQADYNISLISQSQFEYSALFAALVKACGNS